MSRSIIFMGLVGMIIANLLGCAVTPSRLEAHYGESFRQAISNQILDPEAYKNLEPTQGLDGQAAEIVMDRYRETFKEKVLNK